MKNYISKKTKTGECDQAPGTERKVLKALVGTEGTLGKTSMIESLRTHSVTLLTPTLTEQSHNSSASPGSLCQGHSITKHFIYVFIFGKTEEKVR